MSCIQSNLATKMKLNKSVFKDKTWKRLNLEEIIAQLVLLVHSDKLVVKTTPVNLNVPYKSLAPADNSKVSSVTRLTLSDVQEVNVQ